MQKGFIRLAITGGVILSLLAGCGAKAPVTSQAESKSWAPEKEIQFLVPSSAGGGSDINARMISEIAFKNKFTPKNFMIVNEGGGNGQVAYTQVFGKKGDPNTLMVLHSGQVMAALVNSSPVKTSMLTYIGTVALDEQTLCVSKDGKYKDIQSLLKAAKDNPDTVKFGGSQRGGGDQLGFEMLNKYAGTKFNYVSFNSGGDEVAALLGGHIDVAILNPAEAAGQVAAGSLITVAVFSPERISGDFKNSPTFKELGYKDIVLREIRAIAGPPNMPAEAVKFYEDLLKKVTETEEWKKGYIEKNHLTNFYQNAADSKKYHEEQIEVYTKIWKEVGLMK